MLIRSIKWWLIALVSLISIVGCAFQYGVTNVIDSRALPQASNYKSYWLLPGSQNIVANSLAFIDYSNYINTMLTQLGYRKASSKSQANVIIFLSYEVSEPRIQLYASSTPVWWSSDIVYPKDCLNCWPMPMYQNTVYSENVYTMTLRLDAYEAQAYFKQKKLAPLWSVYDQVTNDNSDLRRLFPYMVAAVSSYIAKDSQQQVKVTILQNDPTLQQLLTKRQSNVKLN